MDPPISHPGQNYDAQLAATLQTEIFTRHSLPVTLDWINSFLVTVKLPTPPLPALASTANFRLLLTDFTATLSKATITGQHELHLLPPDISNVQIKSCLLNTTIPVQVLDIEDVGSSRWSQVEAIERVERGEEVRGREVIRTVPIMNEGDDFSRANETSISTNGPTGQYQTNSNSASTSVLAPKRSQGPHKLLLQDAAGTNIYAFELVQLPKIFISGAADPTNNGLCVGAKLLLKKGTCVKRGMVMLNPNDIAVLGGKVEVWDKAWRETRKKRLMDAVQRNAVPG